MTMKFLYTNVELNLPPHLNAALPCKSIQRIVHVETASRKKCSPITFAVTLAIAVRF